MKRIWIVLAAVVSMAGCEDQTGNLTSVGQGLYGLAAGLLGWMGEVLRPVLGLGVLVVLAVGAGCTSMYPKFMDSPEFQKAAIEAFSQSAKTMSGAANVSNPEIEFYYKMSVGGRVIGVSGNVQGMGTTTGQMGVEQGNLLAAPK